MRDNHTNVPGSEHSLAAAIREEIERSGPMTFERFMDLALYAPGLGYYTRGEDPFGAQGDYYTAEQFQPVYGALMAQFAASLRAKRATPGDFQVVELGAGRGEMAEAFSALSYSAVDVGHGELPARIRGLVFANEFFDALPVRVAARRGEIVREVLVGFEDGAFRFEDGPGAQGPLLEYIEKFYPEATDGSMIEIHLRGLDWIRGIAAALDGWLLIVDYGYTAREFERYREGTLMSYRRHIASPDVLADPGNRDITAHVPFTVLEEELRSAGLEVYPLQTFAAFLLRAGEADQFAAALAADAESEALRRRMQLKALLYGMGETFRVLVAKSAGGRQ